MSALNPTFFISGLPQHHRQTRAITQELVGREHGWQPLFDWTDNGEPDILDSDDIHRRLRVASEADVVVLLSEALRDPLVAMEAGAALRNPRTHVVLVSRRPPQLPHLRLHVFPDWEAAKDHLEDWFEADMPLSLEAYASHLSDVFAPTLDVDGSTEAHIICSSEHPDANLNSQDIADMVTRSYIWASSSEPPPTFRGVRRRFQELVLTVADARERVFQEYYDD